MKAKTLSLIFTAALSSLLFTFPSHAAGQESQAAGDMQAMMAKAKEFGTPGAEHAVLKPLEGEWATTATSWMKPADKAIKSVGTSTISWALDGHFLKQKFKGDMMGQAFEGLGFVGYDKMKKEYNSVWMDNMSTSIFQSSGQFDAKTKTLRDSGTFSCPITGDTNMPFRTEWKIINNDNNIYSMFVKDAASGKEYKSMEIRYKRTK